MGRLYAELPTDRTRYGTITLFDTDVTTQITTQIGPFPCYGKADNQHAIAHGNPHRYPEFPYGDHPLGLYRVVLIEANKRPARSYGPFFIRLDPKQGPAHVSKINGRSGLAIHGGDPGDVALFRPTEGCLRVTNAAITEFSAHIRAGDFYECVKKAELL